jgi:hypothetical protein
MVLLCIVFKIELKAEGVLDEAIDRRIVTEFHRSFRSHVSFHFFCLVALPSEDLYTRIY